MSSVQMNIETKEIDNGTVNSWVSTTYSKQRRDRLADVVGDYLSDENVSVDEFVRDLKSELQEWVDYHERQRDRASGVLEALKSV